MVLAFLCKTVLTGQIAVVGNMKAQGLYHIIKKGVHRMDRAAVDIQDDMISVVDILMNQNNSPICVVN